MKDEVSADHSVERNDVREMDGPRYDSNADAALTVVQRQHVAMGSGHCSESIDDAFVARGCVAEEGRSIAHDADGIAAGAPCGWEDGRDGWVDSDTMGESLLHYCWT